MSQKRRTKSKTVEAVENQVFEDTPKSVIDAIATQIDRAEEAAGRIEREGSVVRDMRGTVIEHPAIAIERNAIKLYTDLFKKWGD